MKSTSALVALGVILGMNPASGFQLRRKGAGKETPEIKTPEEIHEKWTGPGGKGGLNDVLEILFTVACRSKHQKDTHGLAAHIMKEEGLSTEEFTKKKAEIQADNIVQLKQGCGMVVAEGEKKCRTNCAEGWNAVIEKRNECDDLCVESYATFEKRCHTKAEDLQDIYKMEMQILQSQQRCLTQHCETFPTTYTMDDEAKQKEEVEKRCKDRCTDDQIKTRCENKFSLSADMVDAKAASECASEGTTGKCVEDKLKEVGGDKDKCQSEGEGKCDEQNTECEGKGDAGKEFCKSRRTMCQEKVTAKCGDEHKKALDKAKDECEKTGDEEYVKCKEDKMKSAEEEGVKKCETDKKKSCPDDCKKKCEVEKMNACVKKFTPDPANDPTQFFCEKTWKFLVEGSKIDEMTGNMVPP